MADKYVGFEPISLFLIAEKTFPQYKDYEPEIIMEGMRLSPLECEKLLACQNVFHNHNVFHNYVVFEKTCVVFNNIPAMFGIIQRLEPHEITYAVQCIRNIDAIMPFSNEILAYIALIFHTEGVRELPEILKKEVSDHKISCEWFLNDLNKGDKPDSEEAKKNSDTVQEGFHKIISDYLAEKAKKEMVELEANFK